MYPHQLDQLTAALDEDHLDALVGATPANVRYLTGFESLSREVEPATDVLGVFTRAGSALVIPSIEAPTVAVERPDTERIHCYGRFVLAPMERSGDDARRAQEWIERASPGPAEALRAALEALGVAAGRIGVDDVGLSASAWNRITRGLGARVVAGADALARARSVKGPYEIECLERALVFAEEALNEVIQILKPGVTEREAVDAYEDAVRRRGARPWATRIGMGDRSALVAASPSTHALRSGELVRLDVGCTWKGYHACVARTAVMGEPTRRQAEVFEAVEAGLDAVIDRTSHGMRGEAIFDLTVETTRARGLAGFDLHAAGHGIGLEPAEPPLLAPRADGVLAPGMVLAVESQRAELGWGGVHIKETVLVVATGVRPMNRSHRGLVVLD